MKSYIDENKKEILELGETLFKQPELGYKEFKNKKTLVEYLTKYGFKIENECFETGFSVSIGKGKPHIGLIAELDALPTLGHKYCNKQDNNAAHSCGHSSQCAIMAAAMVAIKKHNITKGKVTLFFTPAEEYTDIEYRKKLIKQGKIHFVGGKQNMIEKGLFDDVDMFIHLHTKSNDQYHYCINTRQGGFIYKKYTFFGKAAHAAVCPDKGINALNAYNLFNNAVNALRETFKEADAIRIHGIVNEGGQTVNSIAERVVYECYIRSFNTTAMLEVADKIDNAAKCCAKAIGAKCKIETRPGYLSLVQSEPLNDFVYKHMLKNYKEEDIKLNSSSMAASDLGDLSCLKPVIQFGYSGFKGVCHSKDLEVINPSQVYLETSKLVEDVVCDLLLDCITINKIRKQFKPRLTKQEYLKLMKGR